MKKKKKTIALENDEIDINKIGDVLFASIEAPCSEWDSQDQMEKRLFLPSAIRTLARI